MSIFKEVEEKIKNCIIKAGYNVENVILEPTSRKDLGEYQINSAFSLGKENHCNPRLVAENIVKELEDKKYIVEMDGGIGHGNFTRDGKQDVVGKQVDDKKDELAKSHNIKVIRVDCNYIDIENRYDYIKEHILISEMSQILDLSKINFSLCRIVAEKSIFISVCDLVKQGMRSFVEIAEKLEISNTTVSRYLKTACESGYLDMDYNDLKKQSLNIGYEKNKKKNESRINGFNRTPVKCIETGEIFNSMDSADKKYGGCVSSYLSGRIKYTGHLADGTVLHWERI